MFNTYHHIYGPYGMHYLIFRISLIDSSGAGVSQTYALNPKFKQSPKQILLME